MFRSIRFILAVVVLIVLVFGFVWALTRPQDRPKVDSRPLQAERAIQKSLTAIGKMMGRGQSEVSLSEDEINALTEGYFQGAWWTKEERARKKPGPYEMTGACVSIHHDAMTLFFDMKYRGVPIYAKFRGVPTLVDHRIGFNASSAKIGAVPLPGFVADRILARALGDPVYRKSLTMRKEIRDIRVEKEDLILVLER